ncbi:hypothetical protein XENTR_v10008001 [Xenopus tropicalis]|nr:hypothetical protein XENTR_v10008001 [Xenopus tropicalis]
MLCSMCTTCSFSVLTPPTCEITPTNYIFLKHLQLFRDTTLLFLHGKLWPQSLAEVSALVRNQGKTRYKPRFLPKISMTTTKILLNINLQVPLNKTIPHMYGCT